MTEASKRSRSVYVAARAKCRNAGLNMASAQAVIDAFNQLDMFSLQDAAERCLLEEVKAGGAKESKGGETKGESADSKQPGTIGGQLLATVVRQRARFRFKPDVRVMTHRWLERCRPTPRASP